MYNLCTVEPLCIDSRVLGTARHLLYDDEKFSWCIEVPKGTWYFSGQLKPHCEMCLDTALAVERIKVDCDVPKKWRSIIKCVARQPLTTVPWVHVMPIRDHRAFVERLVFDILRAMASVSTDYYRATWVPCSRIFCALERARVNAQQISELIALNVGNVPAIASFVPLSDGLASAIEYDRLYTRTGRLTVKAGPQILTISREHRSIIMPSSDNVCLCYADFAALEARVMLYEAGKRCPEADLYAVIARESFGNRMSRNDVKGAVLTELYGMSKHELGNRLKIGGSELDDFVSSIKTFFDSSKLRARVKKQYVRDGFIRNRYKRRIDVDNPLEHILINSYVQSTGCDVVLKGFLQLIDEYSPAGLRPLFLLHDAIIFEAPASTLEALGTVKWLKIDGYVQRFPVRFEAMNCCVH